MTFSPELGENVVIQIETATAGTFVNINGVDKYSRNSQRPVKKQLVFMSSIQIASTGPLDESVTFSGIIDAGDAGILRILAQKAADVMTNFQFLYDGTNGYKQLFKISGFNSDGTPDGYLTFSGSLTAEANAVVVGTGPIF